MTLREFRLLTAPVTLRAPVTKPMVTVGATVRRLPVSVAPTGQVEEAWI